MYRPKPQYSNWMTSAVEGQVGPVEPTKVELAVLQAISDQLLEKKQREHRDLQEDIEVEVEDEVEEMEEDGAEFDEGNDVRIAPPAVAPEGASSAIAAKSAGGSSEQDAQPFDETAQPLPSGTVPSKKVAGVKRKAAAEAGSKRART